VSSRSGLGLRRACEGAWGRAKCVVGAGRTRLRTRWAADVDLLQQVGRSADWAALAGGMASR
jgi:hypothetical protein